MTTAKPYKVYRNNKLVGETDSFENATVGAGFHAEAQGSPEGIVIDLPLFDFEAEEQS